MTNKEAIEALTSKEVCNSEIMLEALEMAIKALKQYGVLQEIRTEIEKPLREERYFVTANAKAQYIALNWVYELIDKHIKEIEE